jgi:integration host factor subunit alpha
MTKADLVNKIFDQIGGTKKESADLVDKMFDLIRGVLSNGESVKISGFGNFIIRNKKSRVGRNPQTGQSIEISARRVLTFKPSQVLRDSVNKDTGN